MNTRINRTTHTTKTTDPGGCANIDIGRTTTCNAATIQRHSHDAHGHGDQFTTTIGKTRRRR